MRRPEFSPIKPKDFDRLESMRQQALLREREQTHAAKPLERPCGPESEQARIRLEKVKVWQNAQILGSGYEALLPQRGLGQAFQETLQEVATRLEKKYQKTDSPLFVDALAELRLLTEVDRALLENNFTHFENLSRSFAKTPEGLVIDAQLKDIYLNPEIEARWARWCLSSTGIRLSVTCFDLKKQKDFEVQARMDFHYRGPEGKKSERKQAALDLEGIFLSDAIRTFRGDSDYHRARFLDEVIKSDTDFATICEGRQRQIQEAINHYWSERKVALAA